MTRRTELLALAERVEAGETGRDFDNEICLSIGWTVFDTAECTLLPPSKTDWADATQPPCLTTSIDAQAALPGRIVLSELEQWPDKFAARACRDERTGWGEGRAKTEPSARLAALLRAMAEGGE
ncbi:MAG TPA: hypothetical protein VN702_17715 [Acetobacteraceae bacterium]|nr:hypothetical protein [Acetobacteraceae bacterium]